MRLLVVEDDADLREGLRAALTRRNFTVDLAGDGDSGLFLGETEAYDAIVLDIGLPIIDGLSVLMRWREGGVAAPVLLLTARDRWRDKVQGLRAGADDYLAKPFQTEELLARIEALIRRANGHSRSVIELGALEVDLSRCAVALAGEPVALTPNEYRILAFLALNRGRVVGRTELTEHLYAQDFDKDSNVIEATIARLRKKIGAARVKTQRGHGYFVE